MGRTFCTLPRASRAARCPPPLPFPDLPHDPDFPPLSLFWCRRGATTRQPANMAVSRAGAAWRGLGRRRRRTMVISEAFSPAPRHFPTTLLPACRTARRLPPTPPLSVPLPPPGGTSTPLTLPYCRHSAHTPLHGDMTTVHCPYGGPFGGGTGVCYLSHIATTAPSVLFFPCLTGLAFAAFKRARSRQRAWSPYHSLPRLTSRLHQVHRWWFERANQPANGSGTDQDDDGVPMVPLNQFFHAHFQRCSAAAAVLARHLTRFPHARRAPHTGLPLQLRRLFTASLWTLERRTRMRGGDNETTDHFAATLARRGYAPALHSLNHCLAGVLSGQIKFAGDGRRAVP